MREIKKIDKNSREECLKFELQIAKERIEELENKLHIVLEDNKSMYNTVYQKKVCGVSREKKFRVWVKADKPTPFGNKMIKSEYIGVIYFENKFIRLKETYGEYDYSFNDIEFLQYTGLKDKNGVEIYEGDIVRLWYTFENEYFEERTLKSKGVIKFDRGMFTVNFEGYDYYVDTDGLILEVIDNIYENKELLENE